MCSPSTRGGRCSTPPPRAIRRCARPSRRGPGRAGCRPDADDLLVTTGSQQALTLLATALLEPGDVVLVEDPLYLAALQCFGFAGARVVPVPRRRRGVDPVALDGDRGARAAQAALPVPTFQNPTGRTLPLARRQAVAEVAARRGLWIVEDDPYGELRFEGEHDAVGRLAPRGPRTVRRCWAASPR